ncbi:glycogen synthase kinase-3-like [Varroa jacobsoni]|uniref:Protein kinase domain-containing protein n=1 Tax=Varroa destructor TaxID=109461 RepID=A0A7M7M694_VARDE|nr:glycogen synthase kinase-3-like isoform X1 [Varroa destructor]XP_022700494.1 glycogen synthase kinase-3-like [Varroa jacobsoni]
MGKKREVTILPFLTNWYKGRKSESEKGGQTNREKSDPEARPKTVTAITTTATTTSGSSSEDSKDWEETTVDSVNGTCQIRLCYRVLQQCGKGTFGTVFKVKVESPDSVEEILAMKLVKSRKRAKMREINMMKLMNHPNLVKLRYFCTVGMCQMRTRQLIFMEWMPESLHVLVSRHKKQQVPIAPVLIRCFTWQVCRGLAFMHHRGIAHRDLKPLNMLVDFSKGLLKVCDFGSAKLLTDGVPNTAYICSRWYRAPELLYGNKRYNCAIDIWSIGCCLGEMIRLAPLFRGHNTADQLEKILRTLGSPTKRELIKLGVKDNELPSQLTAKDMNNVLDCRASKNTRSFLLQLLRYAPSDRPTAWDSLADSFFDELRLPECCLPNAEPLPELFNFSTEELEYNSQINDLLKPKVSSARSTLRLSAYASARSSLQINAYNNSNDNYNNTNNSQLTSYVAQVDPPKKQSSSRVKTAYT